MLQKMAANVKTKRYLCGHCNEWLSKTSYYNHRKLYYDTKARNWSTNCVGRDDDDWEDFRFGDDVPSPDKVFCLTSG